MGLPLQGLRVIDLTQDFAGPFCTMMLADLGAEVVKIEKPDGGDETRSWGPPWIKGTSYYFQALNRGKKSVVLDLNKPKDQKEVRKLVVDADIFVESSQPGRMARFKLDHTRLRRVNKALVYASISSFGQTGPYRDRLGYDLIAFAMSGIMASTGEPGRPPVRMSVPVADLAAGHYASTAILAALSRRLVTGRGDYLRVRSRILQESQTRRPLRRGKKLRWRIKQRTSTGRHQILGSRGSSRGELRENILPE